ncbi:MAG: site-2 protease family protein, partial [Elusimicrobiota bacterium]
MKGKKILNLFNFEVKLDPTWLIIAFLVTWSLASGLFPHLYENLSPSTYWIMGIAGAILLFCSIIAHELTHSLVARRFGM